VERKLEVPPAATSPIETSPAGEVRIGPVRAIPVVLAELGVPPKRVFAHAGVDPQLFEDAESRMTFEALGSLLDACVGFTGCDHFGLRVGERFDLKQLGPLGHLMRHCPTMGEALHTLVMHLHLHDRGAAPVLLTPEPGCVVLGYSIFRRETPAVAQIYDAAVAIGNRLLVDLGGPTWRPLRVQFAHGRPRSTAAYRRLFGPAVTFDAGVSGILFDRSWLGRPIEGADATLHRLLAKAIRDAEASGPMGFADRVRSLLHQAVLSGTATAGSVARALGIGERTLRRRLAQERVNLQQLINETRLALAQQLLQNTGLPIAEIAAALHYADANIFSRAFHHWAGCSPSEWRSSAPKGASPTH
jgi:AraC-like DNA-binding protein